MKTNVCVLIADGTEEMEAVIVVDVLRRAGIGVFVAGVGGDRLVTTSRGVRIAPDGEWDPTEASRFHALVIPGGAGGTQILRQNESVKQAIREFLAAGKLVAAICAGPLVLQDAGVLEGKTFTSHPACRADFTIGTRVDQPVVHDGQILTSQAPGTAFAFALALVTVLDSAHSAQRLATDMLYSE